ncbi:MAG: pilin [Phycisphaerae bacterium]
MEKRPLKSGRLPYAMAAIVLIAVAMLLVAGVFTARRLATEGDPAQREAMAKLAWVSVAGLGVVLILLGWLLARWLSKGLRSTSPKPRQAHPSAWDLAGQRMQVPPEEDDESPDQQQ